MVVRDGCASSFRPQSDTPAKMPRHFQFSLRLLLLLVLLVAALLALWVKETAP